MEKLDKESAPLAAGWVSWYKDPVLILALSLVFGLDQVTKAVVRHTLLLGESVPREGSFRIINTFNTGSAFGLFPGQTLFLIVASLVGIAILLLVYRNHPLPSFPLRLSLGMQLGGALGNLVDRLRMGQVTDFIELGFWPVFNLADASIVVGIFIIAYIFVFAGRWERRPAPAVYRTDSTPPGRKTTYGEADSSPITPYMGQGDGNSPGGRDILVVHLCPVCDVQMKEAPGGWRCSSCGVKEWGK